ncbi:Mobile element protein [Serratia fonticola AU-P3(3)]|nr:Mobile element protein [Serratia fonticola AU-P3(3)]
MVEVTETKKSTSQHGLGLPRDEKRLEPAQTCCPDCGGALTYLGEDTAEQLELIRSAFRVIRTVREKHACRKCDHSGRASENAFPEGRRYCMTLTRTTTR